MNIKDGTFGVIVIILLILVGVFLITDKVQDRPNKNTNLPYNATNIINHNNGWYSFDLITVNKNRHFLIHRQESDNHGDPLITETLVELKDTDEVYERVDRSSTR